MMWLSYGLSSLLAASVVFGYRLAHVDRDRRTKAHKRTRIIVLIIALATIVAQQIVKEVETRMRSKGETALRGKVDALITQNRDLLTALSTNTAISPQLRAEILEHSRAVELVSDDVSELEKWKTDFKNEQAAAKRKLDATKLKQQIAGAEHAAMLQRRVDQTWKHATQLYDFIIRTLQQSVQSTAKTKGDKVFSDYAGLPPAPPSGKQINIASITTGTNFGWSFQISAEALPRNDSTEVWLRVFGSCTNLSDRVAYVTMFKSSEIPGTTNVIAESHLQLNSYHTHFSEAINLEGYQTNATAWVRRFIGALASQCDSR
jgi:hypothetical protein